MWIKTIENESINLDYIEAIKIVPGNIAENKKGYRVIANSPIRAWDAERKAVKSYYCLGEFKDVNNAIAFKELLDKKLGIEEE